jgi:WD40 repeat protein
VAISDDGLIAATGSYDKAVQLWNVQSGQELRRFTEPEGLIREIAFSPDGKQVAASSYDQIVRVWSLETGKLLGQLQSNADGNLHSVTYSPSAKTLATADGSDVAIWDTNNFTKRRSFRAECAGIAFSPDGAVLAIAGEDRQRVKIWDSATWRVLGSLPADAFAVTFSPDARMLGVGCMDGTVKVWHRDDWKTLKSTKLLQLPGTATSIALSPRGDQIAVAALDRQIRILNVKTGDVAVRKESEGIIDAIAFSNNGDALAIAKRNGIVQILTSDSLQEVLAFESQNASIVALGFLDVGGIWTASEDGSIRVWNEVDATLDRVLFSSSKSIVAGVVSGAGSCAAALESGEVVVVDGEVITVKEDATPVWSLAFSPDGRWLVGCGEDGFVKRWSIDAPEVATVMEGHEGTVWTVQFLDNGGTVVTTGGDGTVRFWNPITGHERARFTEHIDGVSCMGISPDGLQIVTSGDDHGVRLWNAK